MTQYVNVAGVWKTVATQYVKVGGVWKSAGNDGYVKVGGVWKSYKPYGPYTLSYVGYTHSIVDLPSVTWNIGTEYADRMVFVCIVSATITGVSIGGVAGTLIAQNTDYDALQIWCIKSPKGTGAVSVTVTGASDSTGKIFLYVLSGGAGLNPTFDTASGSRNNSNSVSATFTTSQALNDYAIVIGCKFNTAAANFTGVSSSITPETSSFSGVTDSDGGMGASFFGPATTTAASATISGSGSDSSKSIQILGIKFSKA